MYLISQETIENVEDEGEDVQPCCINQSRIKRCESKVEIRRNTHG